jgi:hypothetical protein
MKSATKIILSMLFAALLSDCGRSKAVVVLDDWRSRKYTKERCSEALQWLKDNAESIQEWGCESVTPCQDLTALTSNCSGVPEQQVRDFEAELATEFSSDPTCHDVTLLTLNDPKENNTAATRALGQPHWLLALEFIPGAKQQAWNLMRSPDFSYMKGVGRSEEIVRKVCAIATNRGATLKN